MKSLKSSELILNDDGSIYHLNLKPEDIAPMIITVGDPNRVAMISDCFDAVELKKSSREFVTHTGTYKGHRISVISTGIGADNIDIVFNELDALVNIDFETRTVKEQLSSLKIIRIGTSGSIDEQIDIDQFVVSEAAIGFDQAIHFYQVEDHGFIDDFRLKTGLKNLSPYLSKADSRMLSWFDTSDFHRGLTATFVGFYGPQGRALRLPSKTPDFIDQLSRYHYKDLNVTNLEMETSAIYAFSSLMGHQAVSLNCILAQRTKGSFSKDPQKSIQKLIEKTLSIIVSNL